MNLEQMMQGPDEKTYNGNYATAQTATVLWTPTTGKRIILMGVLLSTDTAMNIQIVSSTAEKVIPPVYLAANGGAVISGGDCPIWAGQKDVTLKITSSATGNHSVKLWGLEV